MVLASKDFDFGNRLSLQTILLAQIVKLMKFVIHRPITELCTRIFWAFSFFVIKIDRSITKYFISHLLLSILSSNQCEISFGIKYGLLWYSLEKLFCKFTTILLFQVSHSIAQPTQLNEINYYVVGGGVSILLLTVLLFGLILRRKCCSRSRHDSIVREQTVHNRR